MTTRDYEAKKFQTDKASAIHDSLTIEEPLQININQKSFTVSMRTPGEDHNLIRGMLHSEGIINKIEFLPEINLSRKEGNEIITIANLIIPKEQLGDGYLNSRSLLSVSSCGICGRTELEDWPKDEKVIDNSDTIKIGLIAELFQQMSGQQTSFKKSGGTHAAAAFTINGELICVMEDIGRHNAVDKVIGKLIGLGQLKQAKIMTVSGRISYEIITKCFKAGIPFLAAVSAPSSLAVDFAKELGITLLAFCRDDRATCYSNPNRIES